ncbi:Uncharacterised protein [Brevundimonas vancanneytii]|uniref:Uncharacterized protein n=1 Tax=Brevundimonas vancanneytii TaxID=1325724 RepID=A0A4P1JV10_9CAUL|nr:hypothetical protein [Brevundimonas vancanneytii]VTO11957.1 Uncharacterised protein [Brevundimonas vancanneytii]
MRVLAPAGRIILAAAARGGMWARAETTPFGHGRPFTRGQLERLVREVGLEPAAWSQALYVRRGGRCCRWPTVWSRSGPSCFPARRGLIMLEASRRAYARVQPGGAAQAVLAGRPALTPSPAARDQASAAHPMVAARKQP